MPNQNIRNQQISTQAFEDIAGGGIGSAPLQTDVESFTILVLDAETGSQIEKLVLAGTNKPFQPVITPVSQDVQKIYYPGASNRRPTIQVMGGVDEDVRLQGIFESYTIRDNSRRDEPLEISQILERICKEGNVCQFQIGYWVRYGFIQNYTPSFKKNSEIAWDMTLMIVGEENPFQLQTSSQDADRQDRIFGSSEVVDLGEITQTVTQSIAESVQELESIDYLPVIRRNVDLPFNVGEYLEGLIQQVPAGRVASVSQIIFDETQNVVRIAEEHLAELERFVDTTEDIASESTKVILTFESLRARLFDSHERIFNTYSLISASLNTATRISTWNPITLVGGLIARLMLIIKETEDQLRLNVQTSPLRSYVVREGDSLQSIATRVYGDWTRYQDIQSFNNLESADIVVDQILTLPE